MNRIVTITLLVILFGYSNSLGNLDEFMEGISEFSIDTEILKDGDYIEILGSSGNLTREHEVEFIILSS